MQVLTDVMVDLETLGTRPGCSVLSIGAVAFGPKGLGAEFYVVINRHSCVDWGLEEEPSTIAWWDGRESEAKTVLDHAAEGGLLLPRALEQFTQFLNNHPGVKLWGNGSDFDNAILSACYHVTRQDQPWKFYNNRCYRTLKNLWPEIKLDRVGTYHHALDDAKSQALHAVQLMRKVS